MTADEIIATNPEYKFKAADIGGMNGVKGTHPETGAEWWVVYAKNSNVCGPGPWTEDQIKAAAWSLHGAAGHAYRDRQKNLTRPTNNGVGS